MEESFFYLHEIYCAELYFWGGSRRQPMLTITDRLSDKWNNNHKKKKSSRKYRPNFSYDHSVPWQFSCLILLIFPVEKTQKI